MTVVVADTSPLNYLILIGEVDLLPRLYRQVLIPDIVASELRDPGAPPLVADWTSHLPPWIEVRPTPESSERLDRLDDGERAAILLAQSQPSPVLLLIDEAEGRAEAERRQIPTTGTLGVLRAAAILNMTDLPTALARLRATNFRCPNIVIEQLLAEDKQRKRSLRQR
jgi:predicted nucleic acid-binding protein